MKRKSNHIRNSLILASLIIATPNFAQKTIVNNKKTELSIGYNFLIYQSGYGFKGSTGVECLVSRQINQTIKGETGIRMGISPLLPEAFIRGLATQRFGSWQPSIGIETGITGRANFESQTSLLKEAREAMLKDVGYCYLSTHIEPLSFRLKNDFCISILEMDIGSHFRHFGRTMRAQTVLLRIRKSF